jgi:hypothetical protein
VLQRIQSLLSSCLQSNLKKKGLKRLVFQGEVLFFDDARLNILVAYGFEKSITIKTADV